MEEPAITKAQSVFSMSCRVEVNVRGPRISRLGVPGVVAEE